MASGDKRVSTYVFLHLNTTCLPKWGDCRITEICMLALNRNTLKHSDHPTDGIPSLPRVTNKFVLCLKSDATIQEGATDVSQLTNECLSRQRQFSSHTVSAMQVFLKHLQEPVCFIAHNGNAFDFAVLKSELKGICQSAVFDHMFCADSLESVRELDPPIKEMSFKPPSLSKRKMSGDSAKTSLKRRKTAPATATQSSSGQKPVMLTKSYSLPVDVPETQNKSYALRVYYKDRFGIEPRNTHTAEGYCKALATIVLSTPNFAKWVNKNKKKMSEIIPVY